MLKFILRKWRTQAQMREASTTSTLGTHCIDIIRASPRKHFSLLKLLRSNTRCLLSSKQCCHVTLKGAHHKYVKYYFIFSNEIALFGFWKTMNRDKTKKVQGEKLCILVITMHLKRILTDCVLLKLWPHYLALNDSYPWE